MKQLLCFLLFLLSFPLISAGQSQFGGKPKYQIEVRRADTLMGKIIIELFPAIAPNHVRNWDSLVSIHFFDSIAFHRVIPGFMIQGGDPNSRSGAKSTWGKGDKTQQTVDAEFNAVSHRRGILSAARTDDPNSATSQFFICVANSPSLNWQYTAYGQVIDGMNIADSIVKSKRDANDNPLVKIEMFITKLDTNKNLTAIPELIFPANDTVLPSSNKATMRWYKVPDAMIYSLQVSEDEGFQTILVDTLLSQSDSSFIVRSLLTATRYYWRVRANNGGNSSQYSQIYNFTLQSLGVPSSNAVEISTLTVSPNPANEEVTIQYNLLEPCNTTIVLTDVLGRSVRMLQPKTFLQPGLHTCTLIPRSLSAGLYYLRIETNNQAEIRRLVLQ